MWEPFGSGYIVIKLVNSRVWLFAVRPAYVVAAMCGEEPSSWRRFFEELGLGVVEWRGEGVGLKGWGQQDCEQHDFASGAQGKEFFRTKE